MFLRMTIRHKDGKPHRHWSVVESHRVPGGRMVQRPVLSLGEINNSEALAADAGIVRLRLSHLTLRGPR